MYLSEFVPNNLSLFSLQELKSEGRTGTPESSPLKESKESLKKRPMSSIAKAPIVKYAARAKQPERLPFIRKVRYYSSNHLHAAPPSVVVETFPRPFRDLSETFPRPQYLLKF